MAEFEIRAGPGYGRTYASRWAMWISALDALDREGKDEFEILLVRPPQYGNVRITFKKEPEPESNQITQSIVDDPHVVDFPNG